MTSPKSPEQPNLSYFAYCRKSSEDDRQAASIGDQLRELRGVIEREGLSLSAEPFTEEMSAKAPGRPFFTEMVDRIADGEADALLCWDIDRLYRNPVDEGRVRWLLQRGVIKEIRTPFRTYLPQDAGLLMGVEGGRATDHIISLRKGVLRGFRGKLEQGHRPGPAPLGYLNNTDRRKGERNVIPDPERFDLIRRAWDLMLTGGHSVRQIQAKAEKEWGLQTRKTRKQGGKPVSLSGWYRIFTQPFYAGSFWWKVPGTDRRKLYKGSHEPMITQKEFDRVQELLGSRGKPRPEREPLPFQGLMTCGECGAAVTAEEKRQVICSECKRKFSCINRDACPGCGLPIEEMESPTRLRYVYYHCTKRKDRGCAQRSVRGVHLEEQIDEIIADFQIPERLKDWGVRAVEEERERDQSAQAEGIAALESRRAALQRQLDHVNEAILSPETDWTLITPEEVRKRKLELSQELREVEERLERVSQRRRSVLDLTRETFLFAAHARFWFREGGSERKRKIFEALGSNPVLKDQKVRLTLREPLRVLSDLPKTGAGPERKFEPSKNGADKEESPPLRAEILTWRGKWNDVRTWWGKHRGERRFPISEE